MIWGQTILTLDTILNNPGLTLDGLMKKIPELYGNGTVVQFLILDGDPVQLKSIIRNIYCIEERNGHFFYNDKLPLIYEKDCLSEGIKEYIKELKEKGKLPIQDRA